MQIIISQTDSNETAYVTVNGTEYLFSLTTGTILGEYDEDGNYSACDTVDAESVAERAKLEELICEAIDGLAGDHVEVMQ